MLYAYRRYIGLHCTRGNEGGRTAGKWATGSISNRTAHDCDTHIITVKRTELFRWWNVYIRVTIKYAWMNLRQERDFRDLIFVFLYDNSDR